MTGRIANELTAVFLREKLFPELEA